MGRKAKYVISEVETQATRFGGSAHVILPMEWVGLVVKVTPVIIEKKQDKEKNPVGGSKK